MFSVLERPVSARLGAAFVMGAFAAGAAVRFMASVGFGGRGGTGPSAEWRAAAARWAEVESAAERLADALAAKRMAR